MKKMILLLTFLLFGINVFAQSARELHTIYEVAGADSGAMLGYYVKGVGDLNKDGFTDVAVSAPGQFKTYIYYGGVLMSPKPTLTLEGGGTIVSGDFNGDGWIDLAIEKWFRDTALVYFGDANMDMVPDLIITESSDYFGHSLAAGDINGDGIADLIINTLDQNKDSTLYLKGRIFMYAGSSQIKNTPTKILIGDTTNARLGLDLALGDINHDGKMDIIALGYNKTSAVIGNDRYSCFSVFLGDSAFNLKRDYYIDSRNIPGGFKEHVTCFDVNSDGYDDILVNKIYIFKGGVKLDTLPSYYVAPPNNDTSNFGQYPWAGGGGDFNKDSVKDVLLSSTQGVFGVVAGAFVMLGDKAYPGQYVAYRIFSDYWWKAPLYGRPENAGDVNGDGVDDIIIGSALEFTKNEGFFGIYSGDTTLVTEVKNQSTSQPNSFELKQNYPNPFNPETTINYTLPESGIVQIKIFDVLGRELKTLVNEFSGSGLHSVKWDGSNYSSGIYFCSITFNGKTLNNKMLLMK